MNLFKITQRILVFFGCRSISGKHKTVYIVPHLGIVFKFPKDNHGNDNNFGEWKYWQSRKDKPCGHFLEKTIFSFRLPDGSGKKFWVNIQKRGYRACRIDNEQFTCKMLLLTRFEADNDQHHFYNPDNFFFDESDQLKMVDYGEPGTQKIIDRYGEKLHLHFDENMSVSEQEISTLMDTLLGLTSRSKTS